MKQCFQPQILIWKRDVTVNEESKERTVYGGRYNLVTILKALCIICMHNASIPLGLTMQQYKSK